MTPSSSARRILSSNNQDSKWRVRTFDFDSVLLIPCQLCAIKRSLYARRSRSGSTRSDDSDTSDDSKRAANIWPLRRVVLKILQQRPKELDRLSFDKTLIALICFCLWPFVANTNHFTTLNFRNRSYYFTIFYFFIFFIFYTCTKVIF